MKNPANCPSCDSPMNGGVCDLCRSLESVASDVKTEVDQTLPNIWNWEQFYVIIRNDEQARLDPIDDDGIQARILENQETARQLELLTHAVRIRITTDEDELKIRGIKRKTKQSLTDMQYKPLAPIAGLPRKSAIPKSKLEKAKESMSELGIDFDAFTASINFDEL